MQRRAILILCLAIVVLLGLGLLLVLFPVNSTPDQSLEIEFAGFTNAASGAPSATFVLRNTSAAPLHCVVFAPQPGDLNSWYTHPALPRPGSTPIAPLPEGSRTNIQVEIPAYGVRFRLPVMFAFRLSRWEMFQTKIRAAIQSRSVDVFKAGGIKLDSYTNYSREIPVPDFGVERPAIRVPVPASGRPSDYE